MPIKQIVHYVLMLLVIVKYVSIRPIALLVSLAIMLILYLRVTRIAMLVQLLALSVLALQPIVAIVIPVGNLIQQLAHAIALQVTIPLEQHLVVLVIQF